MTEPPTKTALPPRPTGDVTMSDILSTTEKVMIAAAGAVLVVPFFLT
ncbi:hypothetical protein [Blastochloris viridis]|uniref:Uncharacterized protein n=1 Tax=Blastochloris viridis TaxID=1079 RepID=A0A0H5BCF2_BLAVI|nr:hypothetical protein [Blastochloris viridis]ALK08733.1 hypothetical protein BVIR_942 [Blastochloris viridis]BAR97971.1 hypothetical protein BV133_378 [Blastochloris viridis]CUU41394.1 hypothetical protein BVIRIDIS_03850 [Blastochloris viridis]